MKRLALLLVGLASFAHAQFPFELESDRKPKTVTDGNCLIKGGRILTATHGTLENTDILVQNGKIARVGRNLVAPSGTIVIDAKGKVVCPGIVDAHSHRAADGTNEGAESIVAEVRMQDILNPSALSVWQALASGHTSAMILHGSADCVGGQSVVIKYKYGATADEVRIPDAPRMIKFALGENVTRKSSTTNSRFPTTRMGVESVYRHAFNEAIQYKKDWDAFKSGQTKVEPRRDLRLETLSDILQKKIWVQCHCYRSDEMLMMVRLSQEYGFKIGALQHALEAYKIAPELAKAGIGISIFEDEWSFKQEGYDAIPWNAYICNKAGVNVSINTDGLSGTTALNIDAAKTMRFGGFTEQQALQTITINPAKELGIDKRTGSIDVGKDADIAIWDGHPLSVYSKCDLTMIEGKVYFQRRDAFGIDGASITKAVLDRKVNAAENTSLPKSSNIYAIVGATIHPVVGADIQGGTVVVKDGKILSVGKSVDIPHGASVIQGRGLHVYPGFFDGQSSIGLKEISPIPVMNDNREFGTFNPDLDALTAEWVESAHFGPAKFNGVTNVFSAPTGGSISGQGAIINTDGYTTEQLGVERKAGLVVNMAGGRGRPNFDMCDMVDTSILFGGRGETPQMDGRVGDADLSLNQLEEYYDFLGGRVPFQDGGDVFAQGGSNSALDSYFDKASKYMDARKADPNMPIDLEMEAMFPYLKGEKTVVLSAHSASQIRDAVAFAQKFKLKAAISDGSEAWREAALLAKARIPVILAPAGASTLGANNTDRAYDPYDTPYVKAGLLAKAGVKICFQSGDGSETMMLPFKVGEHCAYGLSREDALKALTINPAQIFGVADKLGSIEPGKIGNLIVTDGDPFELTTTMRYVFIDGQPRRLESKHTMLRDKYLQRLK
ncbi:MAG: amidohydrolase family protein [Armatimonadetes bacterium]|nr:amidohydrolase family protein [Armatimonadota bacterium]